MLAGTAVLLAIFARVESRSAAPLVPLRVLRSRTLVGGNLATLLFGMAAWGMSLTVAEYAQRVLGYSPLQFGAGTVAMTAMTVVGSYAAQRLVSSVGAGAVAAGAMALVVAHEPPLLELLPDAEQLRAQTEDIYGTFCREGQGPAWLKFAALVSPDFDPAEMFAAQGPPTPEMIANGDRMLAHSLRPTSLHRPDLEALRAVSDRIVVGVGATSVGQVANRTARALASCLGLPVVEFPGHHEGFVSDPKPFAAKLVEVLEARA